ncbi:MAG: ATP-binding protein [Rhodobacterales bacterium]|nr:MAG: ATP-binding protein [Rhodobacterales bacterium]
MLRVARLSTRLIGPLSLELAAGECAAVQGPSGSGKTLLMRAIADLDPNRGEVSLGGRAREAFTAPQWRRAVALVPAEPGWWEETVGAHFAADPDPAPGLAALHLEGALGWEVARCSTGERQRLALLRALQTAPKVLMLDEPTAALDGEATAAVEALLRARMAGGLALLLITHDPAQALRLATRQYRMDAGRLEAIP